MNENHTTLESVMNKITSTVLDPDFWLNAIFKGMLILVIIIALWVINRIGILIINRAMAKRTGSRIQIDERRTTTLATLVKNVLTYTLSFLGVLLILAQFIDIMPLIAGAGVLGLAIAFGAQNLVRDVITGFFIIFEDQFAIGDYIRTGNYEGTVQEIGLRTTKIKSYTGEIHIIPNGAITEVTNFSLGNSVAVVDVRVAYETDLQHVINILEEKVEQVYRDGLLPDLVMKPQVLGVQNLGVSEVIIRISAECKPMTHFGVKRNLQAIIKKTLEDKGIEIPYPRMVTIRKEEL